MELCQVSPNGEICFQPTVLVEVVLKKASAIRILLLGIVPVTELVRTVNDFECARCFSFLVGPSHGVPQGSRMKPAGWI